MNEKFAFFGKFNLSDIQRKEFEKIIFRPVTSPFYARNAIAIRML